jgi:hypothetical protein
MAETGKTDAPSILEQYERDRDLVQDVILTALKGLDRSMSARLIYDAIVGSAGTFGAHWLHVEPTARPLAVARASDLQLYLAAVGTTEH